MLNTLQSMQANGRVAQANNDMRQMKSLYTALSRSGNPMSILMQNPQLKAAQAQLNAVGGLNEDSFRAIARQQGYTDDQIDRHIQNVMSFLH